MVPPTDPPRDPASERTERLPPGGELLPTVAEDIDFDEPQAMPTLIGRYPVQELLGQGGMGEVVLVRDEGIGREVAAKRIRGAVSSSRQDKFLLEAQVTGQLEHPNIIPVYELGQEADGRAYFTMKRVRGETLAQVLERMLTDRHASVTGGEPVNGPRRQRQQLLQVVRKVCDALAFAHERGVVHRDLKPANLMIGRFGEVYVLDWGLVKVLDAPESPPAPGEATSPPAAPELAITDSGHLTQAGSVVGTPAYMAPEQARGENDRVGPASDVYSIGAVLYHCLTLQPPYEEMATLQLLLDMVSAGALTPPRRRAPDQQIPPAIEAVVLKAMAREPADRYASAAELGLDLERFLLGEPVSAYPETLAARTFRWLDKHRERTLSALVLLLLVTGMVVVWGLLQRQRSLRREQRVGAYQGWLAQHAQRLDNYLLAIEGRVELLAAVAKVRLEQPPPATPGPRYLARGPERPADLARAPGYPTPASMTHAIFKLAPDLEREAAETDIRRLAPMRRELRGAVLHDGDAAALRAGQLSLVWAFVGLRSGLHVVFPGHLGHQAAFDPRDRPWFTLARQRDGVVWGSRYLDASGQGELLSCSQRVLADDGQLRAVVGVDLRMARLHAVLVDQPYPAADVRCAILSARGGVLLDAREQPRPAQRPGALDATLRERAFDMPAVADLVRARQGGWHTLQHAGAELFVHVHRLEASGWWLVLIADAASIRGD